MSRKSVNLPEPRGWSILSHIRLLPTPSAPTFGHYFPTNDFLSPTAESATMLVCPIRSNARQLAVIKLKTVGSVNFSK